MSSSSDRTQASNPQEKNSLSCSLGPSKDWQNLPDLLFHDVIMMVGMDQLENIPKCTQVCRSWNVMVSQMTKYKKVTIRKKVEILVSKISSSFYDSKIDKIDKIITAARVAHHGLHGSVWEMWLCDVDLASLASCVTTSVDIKNVSNCDLTSILDSVKCEELWISSQTLSSEETQALVRAMESGVDKVHLGFCGEVSLDITALTQYSGQGKCGYVSCWDETAERYKEVVRNYSERVSCWRGAKQYLSYFWVSTMTWT